MRTNHFILLIFSLFVACKDDKATPAEWYAGCCDTAPQQLIVGTGRVSISNAFSPNSDGINDIFVPLANSDIVLMQEFLILDRDKNQIRKYTNFQPNDPLISWNGIDGGSIYKGLFYYKISAVNSLGESMTIEGSACSVVCEASGLPLPVTTPDGCVFPDQLNSAGAPDPGVPTSDQKCF